MKRNSISNATSEKAVVENSTKNNSVESRKKIESLLKRISGNPKILDRDLDMINRSLALGDSDENKRYMDHIVKFLKIRLKKEYHLENDSTLLKEIDNYVSVVRQEHNGKAIVADSTENSSVESPKTIKSLFMRRNSLPNSTFEKALVENSTKNNSVESRKKLKVY
ncbi:hypothetical protein [Bartonella sp. C271]|uniref:hypothetical protein n=1 Tax=Bartonella sp. C271 TaxID=3070220 RepID=UPI003D815D89